MEPAAPKHRFRQDSVQAPQSKVSGGRFRDDEPSALGGSRFRDDSQSVTATSSAGTRFKSEPKPQKVTATTAPASESVDRGRRLLEEALAGNFELPAVRPAVLSGAMSAAGPVIGGSGGAKSNNKRRASPDGDLFEMLHDAFGAAELDAALAGFKPPAPARHVRPLQPQFSPRSNTPSRGQQSNIPRATRRRVTRGHTPTGGQAARAAHPPVAKQSKPVRPIDAWFQKPLLQRISPLRDAVANPALAAQHSVNLMVALAVTGMTMMSLAPASSSSNTTEFAADIDRTSQTAASRSSSVATPVATLLTNSSEQQEADNVSVSEPEPEPEPEPTFIVPTPGANLTSVFGMRIHPITGSRANHEGIDYAARTGAGIQAAAAGTVTKAGWEAGYGYYTCIDHGDGLSSCYGHQSKINVSVGQAVGRGETIGLVGSTGQSTGPHLHFEARVNGNAVDPRQYF